MVMMQVSVQVVQVVQVYPISLRNGSAHSLAVHLLVLLQTALCWFVAVPMLRKVKRRTGEMALGTAFNTRSARATQLAQVIPSSRKRAVVIAWSSIVNLLHDPR